MRSSSEVRCRLNHTQKKGTWMMCDDVRSCGVATLISVVLRIPTATNYLIPTESRRPSSVPTNRCLYGVSKPPPHKQKTQRQ